MAVPHAVNTPSPPQPRSPPQSPGFIEVPAAPFASSCFWLFRAWGRARQSTFVWKTIQPPPAWTILALFICGNAIMPTYIAICLLCVQWRSQQEYIGRYMFPLLMLLFVLTIPEHLLVNCFARSSFHQMLVAKAPTPAVRKGSILKPNPPELLLPQDPSPAKKKISPVLAMLRGESVNLVDQDVRTMMFSIRTAVKVVVLVGNVILGSLLYAGVLHNDHVVAQAIVFVINLFILLFVMEYVLTASLGLQWSLVHRISRKLVERKRMHAIVPSQEGGGGSGEPSMAPCDPRAVCCQNFLIGLLLSLPSLLQTSNYLSPGLCHDEARWLLPAVGFYMTLHLSVYGGVMGMCPISCIFGCLVQEGKVPKPSEELDDEHVVVALCYSLWGPIVALGGEAPEPLEGNRAQRKSHGGSTLADSLEQDGALPGAVPS